MCEYAQPRSKKSTNLIQVHYDNDESGQNTPRLGSTALDGESMFSERPNSSIPSGMTQDPVLTMNNDQYPVDQSGTTMGSGDQVMLDAQLPTPNTFDQGM